MRVFAPLSCAVFFVVLVACTGASGDVTWDYYTTKDGLISNDVSSLYRAEDGTIWIGMQNDAGLNQYVDGNLLTWNSEDPWVPTGVSGICEDYLGRVWACSYEKGAVYMDHGAWHKGFYLSWYPALDPPDLLVCAGGGIDCVADGSLWAGFNAGIMRYDPMTGEGRQVGPTPPINAEIRLIFVDADGYVWYSLLDCGLVRMDQDGSVVRVYPNMEGRVCQSPDGTIWLGRCRLIKDDPSWYGVARLERDDFVSVSPPAGTFPAEPQFPIAVGKRGEIVAGTEYPVCYGVFTYDGAEWRYYEAPFASDSHSCTMYAVTVDNNDDIWVGTDQARAGLWVLHRNPGQPTVQVGISVDKARYAANDDMRVYLNVASEERETVDLYIAVQLPSGDLLFYPNLASSWFPYWPGLLLPAGTDVQGYELFSLTLPDLPAGTYRWYAACTHAGTTDFASNIASCEWQFE